MPRNGYRYSLDPFLLVHFARIPPRTATVMDLGTGSGIILFLLHKRAPGARLFGLERQGDLLLQAREEQDKREVKNVSWVRGDIRTCHALFREASFDLVVSNPPYRKAGTGRINPDPGKASARHEIHVTLKDILVQSAHLLKERGRLALIHHPSRLEELLAGMEEVDIRPERLRFVHSFLGAEAKMVLVEGVKKGKGDLQIEVPLVVYEEKGVYSGEMRKIYGKLDS